jgi:hypothetical protein
LGRKLLSVFDMIRNVYGRHAENHSQENLDDDLNLKGMAHDLS